jgi:hypothetical protein
MKTVLKTTNPATLSFAEAVLKEAGIPCFVLDQHMSAVEGSIGAIPRRLNVIDDDAKDARSALSDAGLGSEVYHGR